MEMLANGGLTRQGTTDATLNNFGSIRKFTQNGDFGSFYMIFDCNNHGTIEIAAESQFLFISPQANLINHENGILTGDGVFDITGFFTNNGFISPAGEENTGMLSFFNVLETSQNSVLDINVTPTENDVISMSGNVDLLGNINVRIDAENATNFEVGQVITILTASNGIDTCNFPSQIQSFDNDVSVVFNVFCDGNTLKLEVDEVLFLGANDFQTNAQFKLYPNPVSQNENVTIEASAEILSGEKIAIVVYDVLGNVMEYTPTISAQSAFFTLENVASGLYFVQLKDEDLVVATRKLLVK